MFNWSLQYMYICKQYTYLIFLGVSRAAQGRILNISYIIWRYADVLMITISINDQSFCFYTSVIIGAPVEHDQKKTILWLDVIKPNTMKQNYIKYRWVSRDKDLGMEIHNINQRLKKKKKSIINNIIIKSELLQTAWPLL